MLEICDHAENGLPPVLAGYHGQCAAFTQSLRAVRAERAYFKNLVMNPPANG